MAAQNPTPLATQMTLVIRFEDRPELSGTPDERAVMKVEAHATVPGGDEPVFARLELSESVKLAVLGPARAALTKALAERAGK